MIRRRRSFSGFSTRIPADNAAWRGYRGSPDRNQRRQAFLESACAEGDLCSGAITSTTTLSSPLTPSFDYALATHEGRELGQLSAEEKMPAAGIGFHVAVEPVYASSNRPAARALAVVQFRIAEKAIG